MNLNKLNPFSILIWIIIALSFGSGVLTGFVWGSYAVDTEYHKTFHYLHCGH